MTEPGEGIEQLDVHTLWEHEALKFTPWLAENLHLLRRGNWHRAGVLPARKAK